MPACEHLYYTYTTFCPEAMPDDVSGCDDHGVLSRMCRSIKPLFNFDPPASDDEIRAAALQFVRKTSGMTRPSKANEIAFEQAVDGITTELENLFAKLQTSAPTRNRELMAERARARSATRFPRSTPREGLADQ